ncbi:TetR/AcrR family transcriptional regulator [Niallia circulans]|uniref:TetR/AcrR family transcriptional regulator n=1 Tax=Niallia circulans TaxID=1397 RepID=A0A553SIG5_NIACI|nr:TetR/AcrR family transcriptional regulator [Niallia circulans]TRZ36779.1 TetR/AcrR family transcriptional regulator [Niallia circulans]
METTTTKSDPRVLRTRQLILDAFTVLIQEKDFKDITVKDITEKATINRATFYAHFLDKYELLDLTLLDGFRETLHQRLSCHAVFNENSLSSLFYVMCQYHQELSGQCAKNYESLGDHFQNKMIEAVHDVILHLLEHETNPKEEHIAIATTLSWGIYGASYSWNKEGRKISAEELVETMVPIWVNGLYHYFKG